MNWLLKYKKYLLPWAVLLVYLLLADRVYTALILKHGKPVEDQPSAYVEAGEVVFNLDNFLELNYDGEEMYELRGWAFSPSVPDLNTMETKIVLHSVSQELIFIPDVWVRADLTKAMPQYNMDLQRGGFRVLISKNALKIDNYQIGILLTDQNTGTQHYRLTGRYIERTPNRLRFIEGP